MGLDLGGFLGGIAEAAAVRYVDNRMAPQAGILGQIQGIPESGGGMGPIGGTTPVLGLPFADVIRDPPGTGYVWDPSANCGNGKWKRKRRRRHRNLATRGDIKDLSALKGVLGAGKLLEVWIATHS